MEELLNNTNNYRNCSYCRSNMHTIRGCNSLDIEILFDCLQQAFEIIRQTNTQRIAKNLYTHWLINTYNLQQLKVIAVTRMNSRTSGLNKADYADIIWNIINYQHENNEEVQAIEEVEWSIDRLPNPDEFQTPPTMSPRVAPPEIQRNTNNDDDDELIINSIHPPPFVGFGYIPSFMTRNDARMALLEIRRERMENEGTRKIEKENLNINVKTQEFIGLSELLEDNFECSICYENHDKSMKLVLGCNHEFCTECIIKTLKTNNKPRCAFCRDVMKDFTVYNNEEFNKLKTCCRIK